MFFQSLLLAGLAGDDDAAEGGTVAEKGLIFYLPGAGPTKLVLFAAFPQGLLHKTPISIFIGPNPVNSANRYRGRLPPGGCSAPWWPTLTTCEEPLIFKSLMTVMVSPSLSKFAVLRL